VGYIGTIEEQLTSDSWRTGKKRGTSKTRRERCLVLSLPFDRV